MLKSKKALDHKRICEAFPIDENSIVEVKSNANGLVNNTYHLILRDEEDKVVDKYILQRINTYVFENPEALMLNIVKVTDFLRDQAEKNGLDPERESMEVIQTRDGKNYYKDSDDSCWRLYTTVPDSYCINKVEKPKQFYESARAFGHFQYLLNDFDATELYETIEKFHDTRNRLANLEKAIEADKMGRVQDVQKEIAFVRERRDDCYYLMDRQEADILPLRVTHNDTKLNNVLFDIHTDEALAVIDLDTVMPGLSVNDFGDSIRFGANTASEDETDLDKVKIDLTLYEAYTRGFMETCGEILTDAEKHDLYWGAKSMTLECGIRFLTDYLEGDVYFSIDRPEHNLDRARCQFKLVEEMEKHKDEMEEIVKKYI